ncbi:trypsin-3-like [Branchiostoma floridae]|uniref:Trypsin-3-like n=1 Tax=Branchiostoma floridae TaxID=7739 RepID=A0A9J7LJ80_BRAFL|nr:trypsin-3-like [Branchiostoma floridae]
MWLLCLAVCVLGAQAQKGADGGKCGVPAIQPYPGNRIVGGQAAKPGSWPWQVSVRYYTGHYCGGSIIAPNWIVTAAHCFYGDTNPGNLKIHVGSHYFNKKDRNQQNLDVIKVIVHKQYNSRNIDNDIALLKLSSSIEFTDYASPVCLPTVDAPDGTMCYVTGWGDTKGTGSDDVLRQATVPVMSRKTCSSRRYYGGQVTHNMICAGYEQGGVDPSQGDSGGPLVCQYSESDQWTLDGITSWGYGCAQAYKPGVYTRVTNYISGSKKRWRKIRAGKHRLISLQSFLSLRH